MQYKSFVQYKSLIILMIDYLSFSTVFIGK